MADLPDDKLSPFQRAAEEALMARRAEAGKAAPSGARGAAGAGPFAAGKVAFGPGGSQTDSRAPFLATEAAQFLKAQQTRMESARREAERARLKLEAERVRSHLFLKKQEVARIATRLRAAESALVAARADERRAKTALTVAGGAIHEKNAARDHLAKERAAMERDFERRETGEAKAVEATERDLDKLAKRGAPRFAPQYQEVDRRRHDRQRGLTSIRQERIRRQGEATSRDLALAREMARAEQNSLAARRALELATRLAEKYEQQVRAFGVAKQSLESDMEALHRALATAEAAIRRTEISRAA